jgi:hypothetical protein
MSGDVRGLYSALGVELPPANGAANVAVACFINPEAHRRDDKNKSSSVSMETGAFNCHGCGVRGGPYDAALALGKPPRDAMEMLRGYELVSDDYSRPGRPARRSDEPVLAESGKPPPVSEQQVSAWQSALLQDGRSLARLEELRGWTSVAVESLGVGVNRDYRRPAGGPIIFPARDARGTLTGCVNYMPDPAKRSGSKSIAKGPRQLFPAPESIAGDVVWLVEGEPDVVAAHSIDLPAVGVPGVESWKDIWADRFSRFSKAVVCVHDDEPGERLAKRLADALAPIVGVVPVDLRGFAGDQPGSGYDLTDLVLEARANGGVAHLKKVLNKTVEAEPMNAAPPAPEKVEVPSRTLETNAPLTMDKRAFHGLAGDVVKIIGPQSEADPAALLAQFLAGIGNSFGRGPHVQIEGDAHAANLYVGIVGDTSSGRKGTSWGRVKQLLALADSDWVGKVAGGLASGEGLIWAVRDPISKEVDVREGGKPTGERREELVDEGVPDKRLLIQESELSRVLRSMKRESSILSAVLRELWDSGDARSMSKNQPGKTTGAMLSVIAHTTAEELRRELTDMDAANGFANRFLWVKSHRSKLLPRGGHVDEVELGRLANEIREVQRFASVQTALDFDSDAWALWESRYERLTTGRPGLAGSILARGAPQVRRLSLVYAVLDMAQAIRCEHLQAALAVWDYCERSVLSIFGQASGYPDADRTLDYLREAAGDGRTKTEIRNLFDRNKDTEPILSYLRENGLAYPEVEETGGRPAERWFCEGYDRNAKNDKRVSR